MNTMVTRNAPDFTATAVMPDDSLEPRFSLGALEGRFVILLFYPLDFTFVCPSEILAFNDSLEEFRTRECDIVGVSVDSEYAHLAWKRTPVEQGGIGPIGFPLVSDLSKQIARDYGILINDAVALRGLFLIDRAGIVRHAVINDLPLGRSVREALRMLDALRLHEKTGSVCPADWTREEDGMDPTQEGVVDYLTKFSRVKAG